MTKEDLKIEIAEGFRKENALYWGIGFIMMFLGSFLAYLGYLNGKFPYYLVSAIFFGTACAMLFNTKINRKREEEELLEMIGKGSLEIVWIYPFIKDTMPFGIKLKSSCRLIFKTLGRREYSVNIPSKKSEKILEALRNCFPQAGFGYSDEKKQWYTADPRMLYKD